MLEALRGFSTKYSSPAIHPPQLETVRYKSFVRKLEDTITVVHNRLNLLWICVGIFIVLATGCCVAVIYSAEAVADTERDLVYNGNAAELEYSIRNFLERISYGVMALSSAVSLDPSCASLQKTFPNISKSILRWSETERFYLDPNAMTRFDYPAISPVEPLPHGFNFFYANPVEVKRRINMREMIYFGPLLHPEGFHAIYAMWPMWLPAPSLATNLGCGAFIYNCTSDCYDVERGEKFYGIARGLLNVDELFTGEAPSIALTISQGYNVEIRATELPDHDFNKRFIPEIFTVKKHEPSDPVKRRMRLGNLDWEILISPKEGWTPAWRDDAIKVLIAGCFVFSALVYWLLLARDKYNQLLLSMLPKRVIDHLANKVGVYSEEFEMVTILFTDICNFTPLAAQLTPKQIVAMLDDLYHLYDDLASKHGVYKVETIGDAYMCACGCPDREKPEASAMRMIAMAKDIIQTANGFKRSYIPSDVTFQVRVGIHSGGVVAGVVGRKMPRYCLFGDVVNTASRMESTCLPMKIHITAATRSLLTTSVSVTSRGSNSIKGKGNMETFFVDFEPSCDDDAVFDYTEEPTTRRRAVERQSSRNVRNIAFRFLSNDTEDTNSTVTVPSTY